MKVLKFILKQIARNDLLWRLFSSTILVLAKHEQWERNSVIIRRTIEKICPDLTVRNGMFQGMRYPEAKSLGSSLFPKLIGSYERELLPIFLRISQTDYTEILDIGCAEGYYAVGLARHFSGSVVHAYDIDPSALLFCGKLAKLNGVADRVHLSSLCNEDTLAQFEFSGRGFVLSDCEGCEKQIFTQETLLNLRNCDVLIEVHELADIAIPDYLKEIFADSHNLEVVYSCPDVKKGLLYEYDELQEYDRKTKEILFAEHRELEMPWYFFTPKKCHDS